MTTTDATGRGGGTSEAQANALVITQFDPTAVWDALSPNDQRAIGSCALDLMCAWHLQEHAIGLPVRPWGRLGDGAWEAATEALLNVLMSAVEWSRMLAPNGLPLVPVAVGGVCRECGCTDDFACDGGCSWFEHDLCSACAAKEASA